MFPFEKSPRPHSQNETPGARRRSRCALPPGMLRAMGKLAERYTDPARSGVYGVRDAAIPRAAAREAGAVLVELAASSLDEGWPRIEQAMGSAPTRACVILVSDAGALARPERRATLEALDDAARACRAASRPFFAVMVDPEARLGLAPLYRERAVE